MYYYQIKNCVVLGGRLSLGKRGFQAVEKGLIEKVGFQGPTGTLNQTVRRGLLAGRHTVKQGLVKGSSFSYMTNLE